MPRICHPAVTGPHGPRDGVTTAAWAAYQIVEAVSDQTAPTDLLRDRDPIYGADFQRRVDRMGLRQVVIAPRAPWQDPVAGMISSVKVSMPQSVCWGIGLSKKELARGVSLNFIAGHRLDLPAADSSRFRGALQPGGSSRTLIAGTGVRS